MVDPAPTSIEHPTLRVLILSAVEFGFLVGSYGIGIWLPQIIKAGRFSNVQVGFLTSISYLFASVGMIIWAGYADRRGGKVLHLILTCGVSALGFAFSVLSANFWLSLAWITVALIGTSAARAIFWAMKSSNFRSLS